MAQERRRTALVTGGSRGIGAATALALAAHGYDVAFTYRNKQARADRVAAGIAALGVRALPAQCDITHPDEMDALYGAAPDELAEEAALYRAGAAAISFAIAVGRRRDSDEKPRPSRDRG